MDKVIVNTEDKQIIYTITDKVKQLYLIKKIIK